MTGFDVPTGKSSTSSQDAVEPVWRYIDRSATLARLGGDERLLKELMAYFLDDAPPLLGQLQQAVDEQDAVMVERAAHALKGLAANLGAVRLTGIAGVVEERGRSASFHDLAEKTDTVRVELQKVLETVASHLAAP